MKRLKAFDDFHWNRDLQKCSKTCAKSLIFGLRPGLASGRIDGSEQLSRLAPPHPPFNVEEKVLKARAGAVRFSLPTLNGGCGGRPPSRVLNELSHTGDQKATPNLAF